MTITIASILDLLNKVTEYMQERAQGKRQDFSDWLQVHNYSNLRTLITENHLIANEVAELIQGQGQILEQIKRSTDEILTIVKRNETPYLWEPSLQSWKKESLQGPTYYRNTLSPDIHLKGSNPKVETQIYNAEDGAWVSVISPHRILADGTVAIIMHANPENTRLRIVIR